MRDQHSPYIVRSLKIYTNACFFLTFYEIHSENQRKDTKMKTIWNYFSLTEKILWSLSVLVITVAFFIFDGKGYLYLITSLIGVTFLIFCAKGNPIGQALTVIFSMLYSFISFFYAYYGEMITYLGMTAPASVMSLVSWMRHPFKGKKSEVCIRKTTESDIIQMVIFSAVVTFIFYFILKFFNTANLIVSTVSITTSFMAVFLTFKRSAYYPLAYAANDLVLIVMWSLAALSDTSCISVLVCFIVFFVNDLYCFINWKRMHKRQAESI